MKDPLYTSIFSIKAAIKELEYAALNGVESWDNYNRLVGRGRGLQEALDIIEDVLKEDEEDNEH